VADPGVLGEALAALELGCAPDRARLDGAERAEIAMHVEVILTPPRVFHY
jgi:hypothetical protein